MMVSPFTLSASSGSVIQPLAEGWKHCEIQPSQPLANGLRSVRMAPNLAARPIISGEYLDKELARLSLGLERHVKKIEKNTTPP